MTAEVLEQVDFRNAMSQFASGVTVVTTIVGGEDAETRAAGFTASAFSSLSLDPPLVLVCLATNADSHATFQMAENMAISILAEDQTEIAMRFAKRGADKFGPGGLTDGAVTGCAVVDDALVQLECALEDRVAAGDHTILVGRVVGVRINEAKTPMLHYNRAFGHFAQ